MRWLYYWYFNSIRFLHLDSQEKVKETIAKACGQMGDR